jgi:hypothetical protein
VAQSIYVQPEEYELFGIPATTTTALVQQAGALVDGYLARPGGLVWSPDATGAPAYMAALASSITLAVGSPGIAPGANIVVPYSGPSLDNNSVGEVVIVDRTDEDTVEACVITAVSQSAPNTITLQNVQFAHDPGAKMEFGLTLQEQKEMPKDRSTTVLAEGPVMQLLSGVGRYGYGRRSTQVAGNFQEFNLLAAVSNFGGPPLWIPWTVTDASINRLTGEVWVPAGILLAYYTEVKIWYVAGFQKSAIPWNIKQATANIVNVIKETGLGANIRRREMRDGVGVNKFENNLIDFNTREMLKPYHARIFS